MNFLAISGSMRVDSTNTVLLRALSEVALDPIQISIVRGMLDFPVFSPDLEGSHTPQVIQDFCQQVSNADGLIISSPEYVRAIPGGLKNAIDWLVSRDEIIHKPVALVHASHRGDDMLESLRLVLDTVTTRFASQHFLRLPVASKSPTEAWQFLMEPENITNMKMWLYEFHNYVNNRLPG